MKLFSRLLSWLNHRLQDRWIVTESTYQGYPMIVRKNICVINVAKRAKLIYKIGFAVPLTEPNEYNLPNKAEMEVLVKIEDILINELKGNAILTLVITTKSMREFVFYGDDKDTIIKWYENGQRKILDHEIQLVIAIDKNWSTYKQF